MGIMKILQYILVGNFKSTLPQVQKIVELIKV